MVFRRRGGFAAAMLVALALWGPARTENVALTFDDVPGLSLDETTPYLAATNAELLGALKARRLKATGFVIGDKLEGADAPARLALVEAWLRAGQALGNHTYSHGSLNKTPVDAYIADVARDDALLRPLLARHGRRPLWFRHPYLETGATLADKQAFEAWLKAHGYQVAPVTLENADWMFALPYDEAVLKPDAAEAARIRRSYLDYTEAVVAWYRTAALQLLGRRPALVFLLHDTRLNADSLGDIADILKRNDLKVVSLDRAMSDPAYRISDDVADPNGDEWLSRWSMTLKRDLPWGSFPAPPSDIATADARLDKEP
ncbi:MAG: polysaccharide deacetylase [Phenylobacterium sp.]|nr:polysaccharide deacetylase [Phenylobacterium sp.]